MHIPFENLPVGVQKEIMAYLEANDFVSAKLVRDEYENRLQEAQQKSAMDIKVKSQRVEKKRNFEMVF